MKILSKSSGGDLDDDLSLVLAAEHIRERLGGRLEPVLDLLGRLERAVRETFGDGRVELVDVLVLELVDEETSDVEALGDDVPARKDEGGVSFSPRGPRTSDHEGQDLHDVLETVRLSAVVACNHSTLDSSSSLLGGAEEGVEGRRTNSVPEDVDAAERLELLGRVLRLVVESLVYTERLDELDLLIRSGRGNNVAPCVLGDLADELADGTVGGGDKDVLALLGVRKGLETVESSLTG